jgi:ABC-type sugar transport system ATPase subunit
MTERSLRGGALGQLGSTQARLPGDDVWLEARGVIKTFGGAQALGGVDLDVRAGEVHGLVGANGAGKSTLVKIIAGLEVPDAGEIIIDGASHSRMTPDRSTDAGLAFIHQELNLIPQLDAAANMYMGQRRPRRLGLISGRDTYAEAERVLTRVGAKFSPRADIKDLSAGEQWLIAIGRALNANARLIAMDEPTASLSARESEHLYELVFDLAAQGISVLFVSHKLDEILKLTSRITVFRNGLRITTVDTADTSRPELVNLIVGREMSTTRSTTPVARAGEPALRVVGLHRKSVVSDVSFDLFPGEVLGLTGLVGAGRTETARMIIGAEPADSGEVFVGSTRYTRRNPDRSMRLGMGYVPEERRTQGLLMSQSIQFNMTLAALRRFRFRSRIPFLSRELARRETQRLMERLHVQARSPGQAVDRLSGGNQQKVLLGRIVAARCTVMILDEPTRGVDVGARAEVYALLRELAAEGKAVLVISSDPEELVGTCDRVLVMSAGRLVGEVEGADASVAQLVTMSYEFVDNNSEG